ncbi:hypothetical protein U8607_03730 [Methylobacterium durans]|uniref:hypothetical protein n=1 Tax=Methylobacterium durans TaxID=2202825 RepID=UPI002AFEE742|nr:hypothetical protein [Methylobacterium durans]MEA1831185.1 hypothetical protein [Methylobacterium durans]
METILILVAVAALMIAGTMVAAMTARGRRPPMRMPNDVDDRDEAILLDGVGRRESPIDRSAQILDLEPVDFERIERKPGETRRETDRSGPGRGPGEER